MFVYLKASQVNIWRWERIVAEGCELCWQILTTLMDKHAWQHKSDPLGIEMKECEGMSGMCHRRKKNWNAQEAKNRSKHNDKGITSDLKKL